MEDTELIWIKLDGLKIPVAVICECCGEISQNEIILDTRLLKAQLATLAPDEPTCIFCGNTLQEYDHENSCCKSE